MDAIIAASNLTSPYDLEHEWHDGDADKPCLVFIHGLGLNYELWKPLAERIGSFPMLLFNLPGHGNSAVSDTPLNWNRICEDINRLLHRFEINEAVLIGHGIGANIAVKYAFFAPKQVKGLVLTSLPGFLPPEMKRKAVEERQRIVKQAGLGALGSSLWPRLSFRPDETDYKNTFVQAFRSCDESSYFEYLHLSLYGFALEELSLIQPPCLLMSGVHDQHLPAYLTAINTSFIQRCAWITVPDASNLTFCDNPDFMARQMKSFLQDPLPFIQSKPPIPGHSDKIREELLSLLYETSYVALEERPPTPAGTKPILKVHMIRGFRVWVNETELTDGWNQRHAKRMLGYLILNGEATRDQFIDALWPEGTLERARNQLRVSLSHLKKLLGNGEDKPLLLIDRTRIALDADVECDLFQHLLVLEAADENDEHSCKAAERLLLELPDVPLPDFYDAWSFKQRDALELAIVQASERVAAYYERRLDYRKASLFIKTASAYDPDNDRHLKKLNDYYEAEHGGNGLAGKSSPQDAYQ